MKSYLPWKQLITKYWKVGLVAIAFLIIGIALYKQTPVIVTNEQEFFEEKTARDILDSYQARGSKETRVRSFFDPAAGIFLEQELPPSVKEKTVVRYVNQANSMIPLTQDALSFALTEAIIGVYEPLNDAIGRLGEGELALREIDPPIEALALHRMSIELLQEYQELLSVFVSVERQNFDPNQLDDDFDRLDLLVAIAKREKQILQNQYRVSLFPKAIIFYEEVIGNPR